MRLSGQPPNRKLTGKIFSSFVLTFMLSLGVSDIRLSGGEADQLGLVGLHVSIVLCSDT